jgi:hypothetical protein
MSGLRGSWRRENKLRQAANQPILQRRAGLEAYRRLHRSFTDAEVKCPAISILIVAFTGFSKDLFDKLASKANGVSFSSD